MAGVQCLMDGVHQKRGSPDAKLAGESNPTSLKNYHTHTKNYTHTLHTVRDTTERYKIPVQYTNKGVPARGIQNGHDRSPD